MAREQEEGFTHRLNKDGTMDSICRQCFATVATEKTENELEPLELDHQCAPWNLERYRHRAVTEH